MCWLLGSDGGPATLTQLHLIPTARLRTNVISFVDPDGPAAGKLEVNDIILEIGDEYVADYPLEDVKEIVRDLGQCCLECYSLRWRLDLITCICANTSPHPQTRSSMCKSIDRPRRRTASLLLALAVCNCSMDHLHQHRSHPPSPASSTQHRAAPSAQAAASAANCRLRAIHFRWTRAFSRQAGCPIAIYTPE